MTGKHSQISSSFIITLTLMLITVVGFSVYDEVKFKNRAVSVSGTISNIERVPKKRLVTVIYHRNLKPQIATLTIPSWDSRKSGEEIKLLVNGQKIKIDEFLFLHSLSIRIFAGALFFLVIVFIARKLRKV